MLELRCRHARFLNPTVNHALTPRIACGCCNEIVKPRDILLTRAENRPINALAAEIDAARGPETGLASAIRLHVLAWYRARAG